MRLFSSPLAVGLALTVLALAVLVAEAKKKYKNYDYDDYDYDDDADDVRRRDGSSHSSGYGGGGGGGDGGAIPGVDLLAPLVLLAPLAGLLSLFGAAAINNNSALITIGVLNTGRKKRSVAENKQIEHEMDVLANFLFSKQHQNLTSIPQRDEIISKYISCSSPIETECFQYVACASFNSGIVRQWAAADAEAARLVLREVVKNPLVDPRFKMGLVDAARHGKSGADCAVRFRCKM